MKHSFTYAIIEGQNGSLWATGLELNGAAIEDAAGNDLSELEFSLSVTGVIVDTQAPEVNVVLDTTNENSWQWSCVGESSCEYRHIIDNTDKTSAISSTWGNVIQATAPGGVNRTHYIHVQAIDPAGNESLIAHGPSITTTVADTNPPEVLTVIVGDGFHVKDDTIQFVVNFNEPVVVTGTPGLNFSIGSTEGLVASFAGTSEAASTTQTFEYTVIADQNGEIQVTGFTLDAGNKIEDTAATPNSITTVLGTPVAVEGGSVDSILPAISGVSNDDFPTASKTWTWLCSESGCIYQWVVGDDPDFAFSDEDFEDITTHTEQGVEGRRYLHLRAKDLAGNLSVPIKVYADILDSTRPTVDVVFSQSSGDYREGDDIVLDVTFDEEVKVLGDVKLLLQIGGGSSRRADFIGTLDSLATTHQFSYAVVAGDNGGIDVAGFAVDGTNNRIVDDAGNLVDEAGLPLSLGGINVDTTAPTVEVLNGENEDINDGNAAAYLVRGLCSESGELVIALNGILLPPQSIVCTGGVWSATVSALGVAPGEVEITATLTDAVGNVGSTTAGVMVIKKLAPYRGYAHNTISTGTYHTCIVNKNKKVYCWGGVGSTHGYLLQNSDGDEFPDSVTDLDESSSTALAVEVTASENFTCFLQEGGKVKCWGAKKLLGRGENVNGVEYFPVFVKDAAGTSELSNIVQIASNSWHACALDTAGTAWCWGAGEEGRLGYVPPEFYHFPRQVQTGPEDNPVTLTGLTQITAGRYHTCALTFEGGVKCWGQAMFGALGNGQESTNALTAVDVLEAGSGNIPLSGMVQVEAGHNFACALTDGGEVRCWGGGSQGQLGNGETANQSRPVTVLDPFENAPFSGIVKISVGRQHVCALQETGLVYCWGNQEFGRLGNDQAGAGSISRPVSVLLSFSGLPLRGIVDIAPGRHSDHTCVVSYNKSIYCWGKGDQGQNGNGSDGNLVKAEVITDQEDDIFPADSFYWGYACASNSSGCLQRGLTFSEGTNPHRDTEGMAVLRVEGLEDGHTLTIYRDSSCTDAVNPSGFSGASSGDIVISDLKYNGGNKLYFQDTSRTLDVGCSMFDFSPTNITWTNPRVTGIEFTSPKKHYKAGDTIRIRIRFSEEVKIVGSPQLHFDISSSPALDIDFAGSEGVLAEEHEFAYEVAAGDRGTRMSFTQFAGDLAISDRYGVPVSIDININLDVVIDTDPPLIEFSDSPSHIRDLYSADSPLRMRGSCQIGDEALEVTMYHKDSPETVLSSIGGEIPCVELSGEGYWSASFNPTGLNDGIIVVRALQRDLAGNETVEEIEMTKDTRAPNLAIDTPTAINASTTLSTYGVTGSCDEEGVEIDVTLRGSSGSEVGPSASIVCPSGGGAWSGEFDISGLGDGEITMTGVYEDSAGNRGVAMSVTMEKDTQAPEVTLDTPNTIYNSTAANYALSGTCSETGESVTVVLTSDGTGTGEVTMTPTAPTCTPDSSGGAGTWSLSSFGAENLRDGNIAIAISQVDSAQNSGSSSGSTTKGAAATGMTIVATPPINDGNVEVYTLEGTCFPTGGTLAVTVGGIFPSNSNTPTCSGGAWSAEFDLSTLDDGNSIAVVAAYTESGNTVNHPGANVMKDTVVPSVTLNSPAEINSINDVRYVLSGTCDELEQNVEIALSLGSDRVSDQTGCATDTDGTTKVWRKELNVESLGAGTVSIEVSQRDEAGNRGSDTATVERTNSSMVSIAGDLPEVNEENFEYYELRGGCSNNGSPVSVSLADTDEEGGPDVGLEASCQGNAWEILDVNLSALATGEITISADHGGDRDVVIVSKLCIGSTEEDVVDGRGISSSERLVICDYEGLKQIDNYGLDKHYSLGSDIDASASWEERVSVQWGTEESEHWTQEKADQCNAYQGDGVLPLVSEEGFPCLGMAPLGVFSGSLKGNGHTITGLYIYPYDHLSSGGGLFSRVELGGSIDDLHLRSLMMGMTGGVCGGDKCYLGGIAGELLGTIGHSSVSGKIKPRLGHDNYEGGGLAGAIQGGIIRDSHVYDFEIGTLKKVGGLVGRVNQDTDDVNRKSFIVNSYVKNSTLRGHSYGGGLVGMVNHGGKIRIYSSYVDASTSVTGNNAGGLVGKSHPSISIARSFFLGSLSAGYQGGGIITQSYMSSIDYCYAAGSLDRGWGPNGGLVASTQSYQATNSFWDSTTLGTFGSSSAGVGLTTEEIQVACPEDATDRICDLGEGFVFEASKYPKVKRCIGSCLESNIESHVFGDELLGGQDW